MEESRRMVSEDSHIGSNRSGPFLLVFRTSHIVTVVHRSNVTFADDTTSSGGFTGFPAYSRLRTAPSPVRGAAPLSCQGDLLELLLDDRSRLHGLSIGGLVVSASLPASPQGPDHLILFELSLEEGRRMVSEDSQDLRWFSMIIVCAISAI
jgi:hypothetical protein